MGGLVALTNADGYGDRGPVGLNAAPRAQQTSDAGVRRLLRWEPRLVSGAEAGELRRSPRLHTRVHLIVQPKTVIARLGVSGEAPFRSRLRRPNTRGGRTRWYLHRS